MTKAKELPDINRIKELLHYNPLTGVFTWKDPGKGIKEKGAVAGCVNKLHGYTCLNIDGKKYRAHRLAFVYMTGECPPEVDHKNRNRSDNRWVNLREATRSQNNVNSKLRNNNKSGFRGVCWCKNTQKWKATINVGGNQKWLGRHSTMEKAFEAYRFAAIELYGDFVNL